MQGLADNPAVQITAMVCGGIPGRLLAAYCETGSVDANMKKAYADMATYYGWASLILPIAALACPPLALFTPVAVALWGIFDSLSKGKPPSAGDAAKVASAAAPIAQQYATQNGVDTSKVADTAGAFSAAADSPALKMAAGAAGSLPPVPGFQSCHPVSQAERNAAKAIALASAKAKAKWKTAHIIALECAKARAKVATARQRGQTVAFPIESFSAPFHFSFTADSPCIANMTAPIAQVVPATQPKKSSGSKLALIGGAALIGAKLFGVLG